MSDYTRRSDIEMLEEAIEKARSASEREHYEKILHKILSESDNLRYWRENLMKAIRVGDRKAITKINLIIQEIRLRETNGRSWGNTKNNRMVN